ncbi:copper transporter 1-like [Phoenix dactylifera]|uniref:Copper transport protein n=1 Tax=Phoenix dactylifera TaxID=42345 RepID=A0A8B9A2Z3_PHODC|nr:copper transporter 1-like [Phoenix dactylifera]XP_038978198.1 copper transporter 1-like [Phoenix dactylifera]
MDHSGMGNMAPDQGYSTHMTFFWGKNSEILFKGWPGTRGGMYALALIVVFLLPVLVEWLNFCRVVRPRWGHTVTGLAQTAMYAIRVGLAYLLMLAVMSFNVGVLIAAILGHALGFLLFGSSVFQRRKLQPAEGTKGDLPPMSCAC